MDSIFRVRFGQDSYPISRFIIERARVLSLSRSDVAGRLGYRDIAKAHRALDAALTTGTVPEHMRKHLATALQVDNRIVGAVIAATLRQQSDEARARMLDRDRQYAASFRPHLRAVTQRTVPQPIFIAALLTTARLLHVGLRPDVWSATPEHRDRLVREAIRDHYREHKGRLPAFGAIMGYSLVVLPGYLEDYAYPFDIKGGPAGPLQTVKRLADAHLGTKPGDARLTGLLRNTTIAMAKYADPKAESSMFSELSGRKNEGATPLT